MKGYGTTRPPVKRCGYIVKIGDMRVRIRATFQGIHAMLRGIMAQRQGRAA